MRGGGGVVRGEEEIGSGQHWPPAITGLTSDGSKR